MTSLFLTEQGTQVNLKNGTIRITGEEETTILPAQSLETVIAFGGIRFTTEAMMHLLNHGTDIAFMTLSGELKGRVVSASSKNIPVRMDQYACSCDYGKRLVLAKRAVLGKMNASIELLDRWHRSARNAFAFESRNRCQTLMLQAENATSQESLRGFEGAFGRTYFAEYGTLFTTELTFSGRTFHPCTYPVNALLSLGYSFVTRELESLCEAHGLDSHIGFFHEICYGRASLALDLIEPFRQAVVDRLVLRICNRREFSAEDFVTDEADGSVKLTRDGMHRFIRSYTEWVTTGENPFRHQFRKAIDQFRHDLTAESSREIELPF